jgi:hypothetical protein
VHTVCFVNYYHKGNLNFFIKLFYIKKKSVQYNLLNLRNKFVDFVGLKFFIKLLYDAINYILFI